MVSICRIRLEVSGTGCTASGPDERFIAKTGDTMIPMSAVNPNPSSPEQAGSLPDLPIEQYPNTRDLPPLPSGRIIGRDQQLALVCSTVQERSTQLLTIVGPGGVGKTRLAVTAAWELASSFNDSVIFIPFTSSDLAHIWQTVTYKLEISTPPEHPSLDALLKALVSKEILIILDSCETVPDVFAVLPTC